MSIPAFGNNVRLTISNNRFPDGVDVRIDGEALENIWMITDNYFGATLHASGGGGGIDNVMILDNRVIGDLYVDASDGMVGGNHVSGATTILTINGVVNQGTNTP